MKSLLRSRRIWFVSGTALFLGLLSVAVFAAEGADPGASPFALLIGFVPVVVLATVGLANAFGIDAGAALTILTGPVRPGAFLRVKVASTVGWIVGLLLVWSLVGVVIVGSPFHAVALLQIGLVFLLASVGGLTTVLAPVRVPHQRITAPTTPLPVTAGINGVGLLYILGALLLFDAVDAVGVRTAVAGLIAVAAVLLWIGSVRAARALVDERREEVLSALREAS